MVDGGTFVEYFVRCITVVPHHPRKTFSSLFGILKKNFIYCTAVVVFLTNVLIDSRRSKEERTLAVRLSGPRSCTQWSYHSRVAHILSS